MNGASMTEVDIDECLEKPCPKGELCRNLQGSYECYKKSELKNIGKFCSDACLWDDNFCYGKGFCGSGECCQRGHRGRGKCTGYSGQTTWKYYDTATNTYQEAYTCMPIDYESQKFKSNSGAFYFPEDKKKAKCKNNSSSKKYRSR